MVVRARVYIDGYVTNLTVTHTKYRLISVEFLSVCIVTWMVTISDQGQYSVGVTSHGMFPSFRRTSTHNNEFNAHQCLVQSHDVGTIVILAQRKDAELKSRTA